MTNIPTITLECKKDGLTQRQDGTAKLTLTVNGEDMNKAVSALWAAPMGTRYQVVMVEIGDDEKPVDRAEPQVGDQVKTVAGYAKPPMSESQKCAMLCNDPQFQSWVHESLSMIWDDTNGTVAERTAEVVRRYCMIGSRSELDSNEDYQVRDLWQGLVGMYGRGQS